MEEILSLVKRKLPFNVVLFKEVQTRTIHWNFHPHPWRLVYRIRISHDVLARWIKIYSYMFFCQVGTFYKHGEGSRIFVEVIVVGTTNYLRLSCIQVYEFVDIGSINALKDVIISTYVNVHELFIHIQKLFSLGSLLLGIILHHALI